MADHPLKIYLKKTGLSVSGFSAMIGVSRQTLHRILSGAQSPKPSLARRIVDAAGAAVSFEELYPTSETSAGVADFSAARHASMLNSDASHRAWPGKNLDAPLDLVLLAGAMKLTLDTFVDERISGADGFCSGRILNAAVEAVSSTHAALANITTRRGPDRLAQALRPVLEEILRDFAATDHHPDRMPGRVEDAVDHCVQLYVQARRLKLGAHASK